MPSAASASMAVAGELSAWSITPLALGGWCWNHNDTPTKAALTVARKDLTWTTALSALFLGRCRVINVDLLTEHPATASTNVAGACENLAWSLTSVALLRWIGYYDTTSTLTSLTVTCKYSAWPTTESTVLFACAATSKSWVEAVVHIICHSLIESCLIASIKAWVVRGSEPLPISPSLVPLIPLIPLIA